MKTISILVVCLFLAGCGATIRYTGNCDGLDDTKGPCIVEAKDYSIKKTIDKNGKITWSYIPKSSLAAMTHDVLDALGDVLPLVGK